MMRESRTNNSGNAFYSARNEAAKYNERFSNKTSASDVLGMDRSRLSRIELGVINPYPEEVALMAAEYHKPELRAHYCRNICPLGRDVPIPDANSIDRITVRTLHASENLKKAKKTLLEITSDGVIDESEIPELRKVMESLSEVARVASDLKMWIEKNLD